MNMHRCSLKHEMQNIYLFKTWLILCKNIDYDMYGTIMQTMNAKYEGQHISILLKSKPGYFIEDKKRCISRVYKNKLFTLLSSHNNLVLLTTTIH